MPGCSATRPGEHVGFPFASTVTFPRLRVPAAPVLQVRKETCGERANREKAFARVAPGAGAHAMIGRALRIDEYNLLRLHLTLGHPTSWA